MTRELTVAVNVRRGEVSASQNTHLFTETEPILRATRALKAILVARGIEYRIDVYSNGSDAEFAEFAQLGATVFAGVDPLWQMQELIEADVLIMAKSSFSYYAALMSDGIKLYEPRWRPAWWYLSPGDDWLRCAEDGSFEGAAFERQLALMMQCKAAARGTAG